MEGISSQPNVVVMYVGHGGSKMFGSRLICTLTIVDLVHYEYHVRVLVLSVFSSQMSKKFIIIEKFQTISSEGIKQEQVVARTQSDGNCKIAHKFILYCF